ncbi:hypothetical protein [Bradyrhizobium sp. AZCC 2230]|uniref:hypothetical protein n=1 Tax=Bradyrhizobium sp. AZCC 2230 TaxID=3117021 RepID=UPI002FF1DD52
MSRYIRLGVPASLCEEITDKIIAGVEASRVPCEVLCADNRAIVLAVNQAGKAADYTVGFLPSLAADIAGESAQCEAA